jgi:hypothetical protein
LEEGKCRGEKQACVKSNDRRITIATERVVESGLIFDRFRYLLLMAHELKHTVDIATDPDFWDKLKREKEELKTQFPDDYPERTTAERDARARSEKVRDELRGKYGR